MRPQLVLLCLLNWMSLCAQAAPAMPNDCWFGTMSPGGASHGMLVATGPVSQWRVGMPLIVYPSITNSLAVAEKGESPTFDIHHSIQVVPTWVSGPDVGEQNKSIEATVDYRDDKGSTGIISLTLWSPTIFPASTGDATQASVISMNQMLHDISCKGLP